MDLFIASYRFEKPVLQLYLATRPRFLILLRALMLITYGPNLSLALTRSADQLHRRRATAQFLTTGWPGSYGPGSGPSSGWLPVSANAALMSAANKSTWIGVQVFLPASTSAASPIREATNL
jgi:hypothetical protein